MELFSIHDQTKDTIFTTFIFNESCVKPVPLHPRPLMSWTEEIYKSVFNGRLRDVEDMTEIGDIERQEPLMQATQCQSIAQGKRGFSLQGCIDYTVGSKKIGGNAQCIAKGRFVHHTSFLWDFAIANMKLLKLPNNRPKYR